MVKLQYFWQRLKVALAIFLPLFTITTLVLWGFYYFEAKSKFAILQNQASQTLNLQKTKIANHFNLIVADLLFFANYSQLLALLENPEANKPGVAKDLALFSSGSKIYDQVRIIDADGKESIRVNFVPGTGPVIVKERDLQMKKGRYYFHDTFSLKKGEIFVSPLDLNIENAEIEEPFKATIRFGTPIFDKYGNKRGIVIFNYLAANLLKDIKDSTGDFPGHCMLLNSEGYWLLNMSTPAQEWGFMFDKGKNLSMKSMKPVVWQKVTASDSGQFFAENGLYTFATIYPLLQGWKSSTGAGQAYVPSLSKKKAEEYFWKMVLFIPKKDIAAGLLKTRERYLCFDLIALLLLAVVSFRLASAKVTEELAVEELQLSHSCLEDMVKESMAELDKANRTFQSLVESTVGHFGQDFFDNLVDQLGSILGCECVMLGKISGPNTVKTLAMKLDDKFVEDYSYELQGTPCEGVAQKVFCHFCDKVTEFFPGDQALVEMGAVGYVGTAVVDRTGKVIGILCAMSRSPLDLPHSADSTMSILAARVAAEIERIDKENESRELGLRLLQAQKMEAIGTLAGGIAHDFNNILSVILGYTAMAKQDADPESRFSKELDKVLLAGERAKDLVTQILAFSRQSSVEKVPLNPQPIIKEALKLLRASLPATIEIREQISLDCGAILVDPTQLHQIIMNLCTNAFHAMEERGGVLEVCLRVAESVPLELRLENTGSEVDFVELTCRDTGSGIAPDILEKIFDPFFTTKEKGKGTGLGLSITYGIVKEYGGAITIESKLGRGTTFHIYLPQLDKNAATTASENANIPEGTERILFVDDEEVLGEMARDLLGRLGYRVTVKSDSVEALKTFQQQPDKFDLVITDQTMPVMTGIEMAREMLLVRPDIPIILCTGYSPLINEDLALAQGVREFVLKPISAGEIAALIRKTLGKRPAA